MAALWPSTLQEKVNTQGFQEEIGDTTITTKVDVGIPKKRARFTKSVDSYRVNINVDATERETLLTFYKTTLGNGVLFFEFNDPYTQTTEEYQFISPPSISPIGSGGIEFRVNMEWRKVP